MSRVCKLTAYRLKVDMENSYSIKSFVTPSVMECILDPPTFITHQLNFILGEFVGIKLIFNFTSVFIKTKTKLYSTIGTESYEYDYELHS